MSKIFSLSLSLWVCVCVYVCVFLLLFSLDTKTLGVFLFLSSRITFVLCVISTCWHSSGFHGYLGPHYIIQRGNSKKT